VFFDLGIMIFYDLKEALRVFSGAERNSFENILCFKRVLLGCKEVGNKFPYKLLGWG